MDKLNLKFPTYNKINLRKLFYDITEDAVNFMELIFQFNDRKRPSAEELLDHPYLKNVTNSNKDITDNNNNYITYRKLNRNLFKKDYNYWKNDYNNIFNMNNNSNINNTRNKKIYE